MAKIFEREVNMLRNVEHYALNRGSKKRCQQIDGATLSFRHMMKRLLLIAVIAMLGGCSSKIGGNYPGEDAFFLVALGRIGTPLKVSIGEGFCGGFPGNFGWHREILAKDEAVRKLFEAFRAHVENTLNIKSYGSRKEHSDKRRGDTENLVFICETETGCFYCSFQRTGKERWIIYFVASEQLNGFGSMPDQNLLKTRPSKGGRELGTCRRSR